MRLLILLLLVSSNSFAQDQTEVLKFDKSKLNDTIPVVLSKQKLIKFLGKPTRIENWKTECALTEEQEKAKVKKIYYYGKTQFHVYDNKAEVFFIDFTSGTFVYNTSTVRLTNKTKLSDLRKLYPKSVGASLKENGGRLVRLKPCAECDGQCLLYFKNGKLTRLEFWEEC